MALHDPLDDQTPCTSEWEQGFEVLDEIGAAFEGIGPEEIERETAKALAIVRVEMRAERESASHP